MQYNGLLCHLYIYIYVCLHLVQKNKVYIYILYCIYIIYLYKKSTIIYKLQSMYSWRIAGYTALWLVKKILTKVLGTSPQPAHSRIQPDKHVRIDKNVVVHMDRVLHLIPPLYVYIYIYIYIINIVVYNYTSIYKYFIHFYMHNKYPVHQKKTTKVPYKFREIVFTQPHSMHSNHLWNSPQATFIRGPPVVQYTEPTIGSFWAINGHKGKTSLSHSMKSWSANRDCHGLNAPSKKGTLVTYTSPILWSPGAG